MTKDFSDLAICSSCRKMDQHFEFPVCQFRQRMVGTIRWLILAGKLYQHTSHYLSR